MKDLADEIQKKIELEVSFNEESKDTISERSFDANKKNIVKVSSDTKDSREFCYLENNDKENAGFNKPSVCK